MIVVVEGPSAAGKTTWTTRHCDPAIIVPEIAAAEAAAAPDPREHPREAAEFWVQLNCARWKQALGIEMAQGVAVCDSDPFKLHYPWSLWRTGHAHCSYWTAALEASRPVFDAGLNSTLSSLRHWPSGMAQSRNSIQEGSSGACRSRACREISLPANLAAEISSSTPS